MGQRFTISWAIYAGVKGNIGKVNTSVTRGGSRTAATSKMECFVIIVNS